MDHKKGQKVLEEYNKAQQRLEANLQEVYKYIEDLHYKENKDKKNELIKELNDTQQLLKQAELQKRA